MPHWLGFGGELLNLLGAIALARDLFLRKREETLKAGADQAAKAGRKFGSTARTAEGDLPLSTMNVGSDYIIFRATKLGYIGVGLLIAGFLLLTGYHLLEIYTIN